MIKKVSIIGVGFMGGSLALALKKLPGFSVRGYARSRKSYNKLKKLCILDKVDIDLKRCVEDSDIVVLALPVKAIVDYFRVIAPFLKKGAIVFDLGSSKKLIEKAAHKYLPKNINFVGCHPLAGSEKSGAEFSQKNLYQGIICLVTSSPANKATKLVKRFWEKIGSEVVFIKPAQHDKILSSVSHLPHVISFSLTRYISKSYVKFASGSFKDLTRISNSPACVWADIFLSNKKNILNDLNKFIKVLQKIEKILREGNKSKILNFIKKVNAKSAEPRV